MDSLKIVIIEDSEAHFELMKRYISKELPMSSIYHFSEAASYLEAVDRIQPDLVILDYLMPGMSGIEFLEAYKRKGYGSPVIMITGQGDENIAVQALKLGASDYVVKTADFFKLLPGTIERVMREQRLKDSLREFETRFRDLAGSTSDWIWEIDAQGLYTYSNPAVKGILGYDPSEVVGARFEDFFPQSRRRAQRQAALQYMMEGRPLSGYTSCAVHKSGREVFLETSGGPILTQTGDIVGYRGIDRDVTKRRQVEQALRESEERFRTIFRQSPIGIELFDECGLLVDANRSSLDVFGIATLEDIEKFNLFDDPSTPETVLDRLCRGETVRYEALFEFEKVFDLFKTGKSGSIYIDVQVTPLVEDGRIKGYLRQVQDITSRRRAEDALLISNRLLEAANRNKGLSHIIPEFVLEVKRLSGCSAAGIRILDEDGNIPYKAHDGFPQQFCGLESPLSLRAGCRMCADVFMRRTNPALPCFTQAGSFYINGPTCFFSDASQCGEGFSHDACHGFGYKSVALVPIPLDDSILGLIHIADPNENRVPLELVEIVERIALQLGVAIERVRAGEALQKAHDELEVRVKERTLELALANGKLQEEVEERRRAQEALAMSAEDLKLFAYSVMHDLKSPTIGIHGLARLLHKQYASVLDEKGRSYCEQILRASEYSSVLVDQINTYIASKEAPLNMETLNLGDILQIVREEFSARLSLRRIRWVQPDGPIEIRADRLSMIRVLRNLVDNALKYGGDNLSELRIGYKEAAEFHIISVSDDGIGIREKDCETIFHPFKRNGNATGISGAGLGLNIVREIAKRHKGTVWVEPGPGGGTVFSISIGKSL